MTTETTPADRAAAKEIVADTWLKFPVSDDWRSIVVARIIARHMAPERRDAAKTLASLGKLSLTVLEHTT